MEELAGRTAGQAGGDIESLCTRAVMGAFGRDSAGVTRSDFEVALGEWEASCNSWRRCRVSRA